MRDRPDLAQAHLAIARNVALAPRHPAAGGVEQAKPEGGDRARIGTAFEMVALVAADRAVEIEAQIGAAVERVGLGF